MFVMFGGFVFHDCGLGAFSSIVFLSLLQHFFSSLLLFNLYNRFSGFGHPLFSFFLFSFLYFFLHVAASQPEPRRCQELSEMDLQIIMGMQKHSNNVSANSLGL